MSSSVKLSPNDPCPCWSGRKFKHCCRGAIDWEQILRSRQDHTHLMSIRGRNLLFVEAIHDALQLDMKVETSLENYKKAFTAEAVRKIYGAIVELWPSQTDIQSLLERAGADVSGLYIGDYAPHYVERALIRHSIYANKILLVDPFQHPYILSPEYNPLNNPEPYRAQTLRDVNFYLSLLPWIEAGIIEFVRTPADFDRQLNYGAIQRASSLHDVPELRTAREASVHDLRTRHSRDFAIHDLLLNSSDSRLRRIYRETGLSNIMNDEEFIEYIEARRAGDPNFLEPLGVGNRTQLRLVFAGGTYEMARLTAQISRSYLFTDLQARWAMIEHDREKHTAENAVWSPFAKAVQNTKLYYLNNLSLDHALRLRNENRLEDVRTVLTEAWEKARCDQPFDDRAALDLAGKLNEAVNKAEAEWKDIRTDMVKYGGGSLVAGLGTAGAALAAGQALFAAAAAFIGSAAFGSWARMRQSAYLKKYPAAFLMKLKDE